jgi:hypothetical protein
MQSRAGGLVLASVVLRNGKGLLASLAQCADQGTMLEIQSVG